MFYFCTVKTNIGLWCNGNTTDSGPVILGSNPGSPTKAVEFFGCFFCCGIWALQWRCHCGSSNPGSLATVSFYGNSMGSYGFL